jgi:flagellar motor switch protein FliN/FliY
VGQATADSIAAEFRTRLTASLEMLCGEQVEVVADPGGDEAEILWRRYPLSAETQAALITGTPDLIGRAIGARVLSAAGLDDFTDEDVAGSFAEVVQSAVSAVAQFVGRAVGKDLSVLEPTPWVPDSSVGFEFRYRVQFGDQILAPLGLWLPSSLIDLWHPPDSGSTDAVIATPPPQPGAVGAPSAPTGDPVAAAPSEDLRRILDLELPIRVSFGKAHVPLRDVLKLSTGSIVELDRSIHEPVDIIVNDRVVGRGEVVVIEGNYGVRIQEIVTLGPA